MSDGSEPPPALGLLVLAMTSPPYLAASNVLPSDDSDFGAPRWFVAWLVVATFGWVGLWMLSRGGPALRLLGALIPSVVSVHATLHGLSRSGLVTAAWLALAAFTATLAFAYWRGLTRLLTRRR